MTQGGWKGPVFLGAVFLSLASPGRPADGAMVDWPRRIGLSGGKAILYEPKVEKHDGNAIEAVAAVSILIRDATVPVVGTVRFAGRILTEKDSDMATLEIERVMAAEFPASPRSGGIDPTVLARNEMPRWNIPITVKSYYALLSTARAGRAVVGNGTEPVELPREPEPGAIPPGYSGLSIMTSVHARAEFPPSGTFDIRSVRVPPELPGGKTAGDLFRQSLIDHLADKGYRYEADGEDPAFIVEMDLSPRERREAEVAPPPDPRTDNREKPDVGILSVGFRNPESGRRMWRGTAEARGILAGTGEERDRRVDFVIGRMLAGFPPEQTAENSSRAPD